MSSFDHGLANLAVADFMTACDDRTVLVAGGTGLIGSTIVSVLLARIERTGRGPRAIVVVSRQPPATKAHPRVTHVGRSVLDPELHRALPNAELAIYVAGATSNYLEDPSSTLLVSTEGFSKVWSALPGLERGALVSSARVYGMRTDATPLREDSSCTSTSPDLRNVYDGAKLVAEAFALQWSERGRPAAIVRLSNVYGAVRASSPPTVLTQMVRSSASNGIIRVAGAPGSVRNHVHVLDVAQGVLRALLLGRGGRAYNIASNDHLSAEELARAVAAAAPRSVNIELRAAGAVADHMYLSTERAQAELGYASRHRLVDTLPTIVSDAFSEAPR